jgi:transcriptional regulator with PAS, ATPase and Fis domain
MTGAGSQLSLRDQTTAIVQSCLDEMGGDVLAVAARLRIGKSTIYRMIQQQELHLG